MSTRKHGSGSRCGGSLAHRVQELTKLPDGLGDMPSIDRVTDWYAQSFEVSLQSS